MIPAVAVSYEALERSVLAFIDSPDGSFDQLAKALHSFQYRENPAYNAYCQSLQASPGQVGGWQEIPAVPAEAFKSTHPLSCTPLDRCERCFLTSGTTSEQRGAHHFANLALYRASVLEGWAVAGLPHQLRPLFLARPPAETPESSLGCMFSFLADPATPDSWFLDPDGTIALERLTVAIGQSDPVLLFSTALALRHLFTQLPASLPLPAGSWVFQTGGYKGLQIDYDPAELYSSIEARLGVPASRVINEYGMTELSTPCYATGLDHPHRTPPWLKVRAIHPETNRPCAPGQQGQLVLVDLANLNSVIAIRTRDLAVVHDEHSFTLLGRDPSALPRGCSRAADAYLQGS